MNKQSEKEELIQKAKLLISETKEFIKDCRKIEAPSGGKQLTPINMAAINVIYNNDGKETREIIPLRLNLEKNPRKATCVAHVIRAMEKKKVRATVTFKRFYVNSKSDLCEYKFSSKDPNMSFEFSEALNKLFTPTWDTSDVPLAGYWKFCANTITKFKQYSAFSTYQYDTFNKKCECILAYEY